jgi:kynureninase
MKVLPDFRRPDNIRLGINPLYNNLGQLETAVARLRQVVVDRLYEQYPPEMTAVT